MRRTGARAGPKNPAWRGGFAGYRGPSWPAQRRAARERDGGVCQTCGATENLTVHHRRPFVLFEDHVAANDLENLVTLCRPCHSAADNAFWAASPELAESARARFPDCTLRRRCERCGGEFVGTARATLCQPCASYTCDQCGAAFVSRKRRAVRFCSKACNVAYRKAEAVYPRACIECGVKIASGRFRCLSCHLRSPARQVRPGRVCGRPPKDRSAT